MTLTWDVNSPSNLHESVVGTRVTGLQEGGKQRRKVSLAKKQFSQKNLGNSSGIFREAWAKADLASETENTLV